jgi:glycosyl transferase family 25
MSQNIDKIIYINLEKRTDRKEHIENELKKFNLPFERFNAFETKGMGILGCGYSHLGVLKKAKEMNYKNILILEDDFMFLVDKEEFETELTNFFNLNIHYDVLFLSYGVNKNEILTNGTVNRVLESSTASGYIVHHSYYDKLISLYEWAMPLLGNTRMHWIYANDQIWKEYQKKDQWLYFIKRIGKQIDGYSDNSERMTNYGF